MRPDTLERPDATEHALLIPDTVAAAFAGVSRAHWQRLRAAGKLPPSVRLGRKVLWRRAEVVAWIEAGCPDARTWTPRPRAWIGAAGGATDRVASLKRLGHSGYDLYSNKKGERFTMPTYITEDCTEQGYLAPRKNLHEALRFSFRPLLLDERTAFSQEHASLEPRRQSRRIAELLAQRLVSWDLKRKTPAGALEAVPTTPDDILRLNPLVFDRLLGVVMGVAAYDDDPEEPRPGTEATR